jgi:prophage regulatory protein
VPTLAILLNRQLLQSGKKQAMENEQFMDAADLEELTGTPKSTWRYWAHIGTGPASFKLGRRRVWRRSTVLAWLADQEQTPA